MNIKILITIFFILLSHCSFADEIQHLSTREELIQINKSKEEKPKSIQNFFNQSQSECEIKWKKKCGFAMCDIGPCPKPEELGWQPL